MSTQKMVGVSSVSRFMSPFGYTMSKVPPKGLDVGDSRLCQLTQVLIPQGLFFCKGKVLACHFDHFFVGKKSNKNAEGKLNNGNET